MNFVRSRPLLAAIAVALIAFQFLSLVPGMPRIGDGSDALATAPGAPHFERTWARTDKPVLDGLAGRTWMWGPEANTEFFAEPYADAPGGVRFVQYFDKSRMEITNPSGDPSSPWYVTNGLLVNELMSGQMQIGNEQFVSFAPANVPVAGDPDDPTGPTYATFGLLRTLSPHADGASIIQRVDHDGNVTTDASLAAYGVTAALRVTVPDLDHQVASPFLDFMRSQGTVYVDGAFTADRLFPEDFYATGYPVTEAYWASVRIDGIPRDVLIQCFQRRCLTYAPGNDPAWQVEAGNVGQHYRAWRTANEQSTDGSATPTNTIVPGSTATFTPTATNTPQPGSTATFTPAATNTPRPGSTATFTPAPTNTPTATNTVPPGSNPVNTPTPTNTPRPTNTPAATNTPAPSPTPTNTPTSTPTNTPTATRTPTPTNTPTPTPTATQTSGNEAACLNAQEAEFLRLINTYRQQNGLQPLQASRALNIASYKHSLDMGTRKFFSHTNPDGLDPFQRMANEGYSYNTYKGENIAAGYSTAQAAFDGWKSSSGHNANMLNANFKVIGIGFAVVSGSPYTSYWTTNFGGYIDAAPGC